MVNSKGIKGFTLIELIVVIAIIGILVGLAVGMTKGYTKSAQLTKHMTFVKELESASERYYMKEGKWPRLGEALTEEKVHEYAERIYDITGKEVELEAGNYYEIDYASLGKYVSIPEDKSNYILQNPVGSVYYLENLTEIGKDRLPKEKEPEDNGLVEFHGSSPEAFDGDSVTYSEVTGDITWTGNLNNRKITVDVGVFGYDTAVNFSIYDSNNQKMAFINLTDSNEINDIKIFNSVGSGQSRIKRDIIVPAGAVRFSITGNTGSIRIYDIYVGESLETPSNVYNIAHTSTNSSITLDWKNDSTNYTKAAIYRDGAFIGITNNKTYTDKPLSSSSTHEYEIQAINSFGNASSKVKYAASTLSPEIEFKGSSPEAFDGDSKTYSTVSGDITWIGNLNSKKVKVDIGVVGYNDYVIFRVYDSNNEIMTFKNVTDNIDVNIISTTYQVGGGRDRIIKTIIVPEGAAKFVVTGTARYHRIYGIDIVD